MKYIHMFEYFSGNYQFDDVFGKSLIRGVKVDKQEYIDDPNARKISTGTSSSEDYVSFLKNYKTIGLQDPTKSVHFYLNPSSQIKSMISWYGNKYRIIPRTDSLFSFSREIRNGGLGSTWFFVERTLEDFRIKHNLDTYELVDLYEDNIEEFYRKVTDYQNLLVEAGVVGNLTYDELLDLSKNNSEPIQVWTETPVLHKRSR